MDVGFLGVSPTCATTSGTARSTWSPSMGELHRQATGGGDRRTCPQRMVGVAQAAFGGEREADGPISVVGASRVAGELVSDRPVDAGASGSPASSRCSPALNLFLALFNLIPLLPLDGGHIAGALWEAVRRGVARLRGRPDPGYVDVAKLLPVAYGVGRRPDA